MPPTSARTHQVEVLLFASLREAVGADRLSVEVEPGATAGDLLALLAARHPAVARQGRALAVAVNHEVVPPGHALAPGDEVALLPPVGGG